MTLWECIKKTYERGKIWCQWLADPDGPSYKKVLKVALFCSFGFCAAVGGLITIGLSIYAEVVDSSWIDSFAPFFVFPLSGYIGGGLLFSGGSFWVLGKHHLRADLKTAEYSEEIDVLIYGVRTKLNSQNKTLKEEADVLISKLEKFSDMPSEVPILRLTPLRKLQALTYTRDDLRARLISELKDLRYYSGSNDDVYKEYVRDITAAIEENKKSSSNDNELRQYLTIIREEIDNLRYKTGYGEAIIESMLYWSIVAGISFFIVGLSPLFAEPYFTQELSIAHWATFGFGGALLATVNQMRKLESFDIGDDEGNMLLRQMAMRLFIGSIAAVVLYLAIQSGMLGGKALPRLNAVGQTPSDPIVRNALSVFWALTSGFSGGSLIERVFGRAEQAGTST